MPLKKDYVPHGTGFHGVGVIVGGSQWTYESWATFHFLDLPPEIRNKIYDIVVPSSRVLIIGNHPQQELNQHKRLYRDGWARKVRYQLSTVLLDGDFKAFAAAISLTKVCRAFNREIGPVLYAKTTFRFTTIKHINKFLDLIPAHGKKEIEKIQLSHFAYGEPKWSADEFWKNKSDWKWAVVCNRLQAELPSLKEVDLHLKVADWPTQLKPSAAYFLPLRALAGDGLSRARVNLEHYRFHQNRCDAVARGLEDMMMTEAGRELRDMESAVEAVRQMEEEEARKAHLPPLRAKKVLVIKDIPKPFEASKGSVKWRTRKNILVAKPDPVYRTKGLDGWSRISLDKTGVRWYGGGALSHGIASMETVS